MFVCPCNVHLPMCCSYVQLMFGCSSFHLISICSSDVALFNRLCPLPGLRDLVQVSGISWCPDAGDCIAISYCSPVFEEAISWPGPTPVYVFNITNPTQHLTALHSPSSLTSIQYNPKNPSEVAGGGYNGQVTLLLQYTVLSMHCTVLPYALSTVQC